MDSHNDGSQLGEMHHFTDGETEAWDGEESSEKPHDWWRVEPGFQSALPEVKGEGLAELVTAEFRRKPVEKAW